MVCIWSLPNCLLLKLIWSTFWANAYKIQAFLGVFFPFFFLSSYAREKRGMTYTDSLNLTLTLNGLKKFTRSYFLLSTHFYKLKELHAGDMEHAAFYYIDSFLEDGKPVFTYQLKEGWSDVKFGTILFEREGLVELLK